MAQRTRKGLAWVCGLALLTAACAKHSERGQPDAAIEPDAAPFVLPDDVAGLPCETDSDCEGGRGFP